MKTIFVIGCDGYIGTGITQRLLKKGHKVIGFDNFWRRQWVKEDMDSISATPILTMEDKELKFKKNGDFGFMELDISINKNTFQQFMIDYKPDVIVNLAHNPSGPYSMISQDCANKVLFNNIIGTNNILWSIKKHCPDCHYLTIGTAGEYDHYNNLEIPEGYFQIEYKGRQSTEMIYPRRPGSIYHSSKVGSTYLIDYLTKAWKLRCTDIMQGVVFGSYTDEIDESNVYSRFDFDEAGGTVLNRFVIQAILGIDLTIYGEGKHKRSFLSLNDSVQALELLINKDEDIIPGKVRVVNQLSEWHSMNDIAKMVIEVGREIGLNVKKQHIETPRVEHTGDHYYKFITEILKSKGYKPTRTIKEEIKYCIELLLPYEKELENYKDVVIPKINFKN